MVQIGHKISEDSSFLFSLFIDEKESNGLSPKSIKNYKDVFARYQKEINKPISKESIQEWIHFLLSRKMNPISINFYIVQIRTYAYWLMNNGHIQRFHIKPLKKQEPQLKVFSNEDLLKLLEKPSTKASFPTYRTWVIINFILGTGARASTLIHMKVEDLDFSNRNITYQYLKNKSFAIIPMSISLERILKLYLNTWDIKCEWLFPNKYGKQLSVNALTHSIVKACKKNGIKSKGPHALRHTFAGQFIMNGGNAFILQRLLNHTDLTMTRKYVRIYSNDIKDGFMEYCPLDKLTSHSNSIKRKTNKGKN